jgi:hypothetical protein
MDRVSIKYTIARPSKIYPNLYFWFEYKPSGNPGVNFSVGSEIRLKNCILAVWRSGHRSRQSNKRCGFESHQGESFLWEKIAKHML